MRKKFGRYVSPDALRKWEETPTGLPEPVVRHFQFVIVVLDDARPEELKATISRVVSAASRQRAILSNVSASIIVVCFGVPFPDDDSFESRLGFVNTLIQENGNAIRVAHGQCDGLVGNFGSEHRMVYEAMIPGFNGILKQLLNSGPGTVVEVAPGK